MLMMSMVDPDDGNVGPVTCCCSEYALSSWWSRLAAVLLLLTLMLMSPAMTMGPL